MKGAPLRFAAAVVGGWTIGRVVVLLPAAPLVPPPMLVEQEARVMGQVEKAYTTLIPDDPARPVISPIRSAGTNVVRTIAALPTAPPETASTVPARRVASAFPQPITPVTVEKVSTLPPSPSPAPPSRLSIDAWLVARPGGGDNLAFGQLGASQGGARLTYALGRHVALSGRVSTPLRGTGREVGIGVDFKPTRLPVHLLVEQRIDLDSRAQRPAIIAIAGGSTALPWQARIDAYGQAGAVRHRGGFADGALLVARPVLAHGDTRVELGAGSWGAAQRRVARLDIGPMIALVTPGAGGTLRIQLDYRARVAGRARPGSGPALTLGGSF